MPKAKRKKIRRLPKYNLKVVSVKGVKQWKDNPRKNDDAVPRLADLLKEHGIRTPIVVWSKDKVIYKGNTTHKAAIKAGFQDIPVIFADFKDKGEAIAYALSDNKAAEWAEWDNAILGKLLKGKDMLKLNLNKVTGFSEKEIKGLGYFKDTDLGDLDNVDIQGKLGKKTEFIVIRFDKVKTFEAIKKLFSMGTKGRVVDYKDIKKYIRRKA